MKPARALEALNFFMADMQAGIGPFLGVFLLAHGWDSGLIGTVMTIGGVAGMIMTAPAGALIDATSHKRAYRHRPRNLHGAGFGDHPALAGFLAGRRLADRDGDRRRRDWAGGQRASRLAWCDRRGFNRQNGRNQAFNHAGNMAGAAFRVGSAGNSAWSPSSVSRALFGVLSIVSVLMIPARRNRRPGGPRAQRAEGGHGNASGLRVLVECKPLLILAACARAVSSRQWRDAAALRPGRRRRKAGRSRGLRGRDDRHRAGVMIVASIVAMRWPRKRAIGSSS